MTAPIVIESLPGVPSTKRRIELVERKGLGHPDTICDSLVEAVALSLNRMYLEHLGAIAHYNVDSDTDRIRAAIHRRLDGELIFDDLFVGSPAPPDPWRSLGRCRVIRDTAPRRSTGQERRTLR